MLVATDRYSAVFPLPPVMRATRRIASRATNAGKLLGTATRYADRSHQLGAKPRAAGGRSAARSSWRTSPIT